MSITLADQQSSLASLFSRGAPNADQAVSLRLLRRRVVLPFAVVATLVALWCAWALTPVVAVGQVQSELGRKVVQHQEGGIVREVLVRQGQVVHRGEALMVVGDIRNDAGLDILRKQMDAERIRAARARSELRRDEGLRCALGELAKGLCVRANCSTRRQTLTSNSLAGIAGATPARAARGSTGGCVRRSTALARDELNMNAELARSGRYQGSSITLERNSRFGESHRSRARRSRKPA
jgi:multidrug efflux pump subunit AcrA (membrane-fusion protein)